MSALSDDEENVSMVSVDQYVAADRSSTSGAAADDLSTSGAGAGQSSISGADHQSTSVMDLVTSLAHLPVDGLQVIVVELCIKKIKF